MTESLHEFPINNNTTKRRAGVMVFQGKKTPTLGEMMAFIASICVFVIIHTAVGNMPFPYQGYDEFPTLFFGASPQS